MGCKYYFFALNATLSDYLTLCNFLSKGDVEKGYVVYDHRSAMVCLGLKLHGDSDLNPPKLLPQYVFLFGEGGIDDDDDLDQTFQIEDGLFLSMTSCDLVQTKNLSVERKAIAERLGIILEHDRVGVQK
jgi:hypothetical protein